MCRILISSRKASKLYNIYPDLVSSLIKASRYDEYEFKLYGSTSHKDGWGRLNIQALDGSLSISIHKSLRPIYVDKPTIRLAPYPFEEYLENTYIIDFMHSRASSRGMPINIFSVQPFYATTEAGYKLYLIHNGKVDKEVLADELDISKDSSLYKLYSDSYILTLYITKISSGEIKPDIVKNLVKYTSTALNIGVILVTDNYIDMLIGSYYIGGDKPKEARDYYKLYFIDGDDMMVYLSSTLIDFEDYRPKSVKDWRELDNGEYHLYRFDYREGKYIFKKEFKVVSG